MMKCLLILITFTGVCGIGVSSEETLKNDEKVLSQLMKLNSDDAVFDLSKEEAVNYMRKVFLTRIRCGQDLQEICDECLNAEKILNLVDKVSRSESDSLQDASARNKLFEIETLPKISTVILNYILTHETACTAANVQLGYVGSCLSYEECWKEIKGYFPSLNVSEKLESVDEIEGFLRQIKAAYEPDPSQTCFSAEDVLSELNSRSKKYQNLPADVSTIVIITGHLLAGECIDVGESVADFLDDIFLHYGDQCGRVITQQGFEKLWSDLQMHRRYEHVDHAVTTDYCKPPSSASPRKENPRIISNAINKKNNTTITKRINGSFNSTQGTTSSSNNNSVPLKTATEFIISAEAVQQNNAMKYETVLNRASSSPSIQRRTARYAPVQPEEHEHKNLANECLTADVLLERFFTHGNKVITSTKFLQICPALVQQAVSGVCNMKTTTENALASEFDGNTTSHMNKSAIPVEVEVSINKRIAYSFISVTIISFTSVGGVLFVPFIQKTVYKYISAYFLGLAFGTMAGDVSLHIMPEYLRLNEYEEKSNDENVEILFDLPEYIRRQLVLLLTIMLLLIIQSVFSIVCITESEEGDGHSHLPKSIVLKEVRPVSSADGESRLEVEMEPKKPSVQTIEPAFKSPNLFAGVTSTALVMLIADFLHNFIDGVAIAVSFMTSPKDGISSSLAIFFHELPHEIADFVVLMSTGLSYRQALLANVTSGLSGFLGLLIGIYSDPVWREWLLVVTAGLFIHIAMAEMIPELKARSRKEWKIFLVRLIGIICGYTIMFFIFVVESKM